MIRTTPSAFGMLKAAPAPKIPRESSTRPVSSWVPITSERARATPACPAATATEPTITAPRTPEATAYITARPPNSGLATISEMRSAPRPVVSPEIATRTRGPSVRWAAPVRLVWTATHRPASTASTRVDLILSLLEGRGIDTAPRPGRPPDYTDVRAVSPVCKVGIHPFVLFPDHGWATHGG